MDHNLGEILKHARTKKKITQQELAVQIGATRARVSYWENNKALPSSDRLIRIIKILDIKTELFENLTINDPGHIGV